MLKNKTRKRNIDLRIQSRHRVVGFFSLHKDYTELPGAWLPEEAIIYRWHAQKMFEDEKLLRGRIMIVKEKLGGFQDDVGMVEIFEGQGEEFFVSGFFGLKFFPELTGLA